MLMQGNIPPNPMIITSGQSNDLGADPVLPSGWVADPKVVYYQRNPATHDGGYTTFGPDPSTGHHGCELTLANALAIGRNTNVYYYKVAVPGSFIEDWLPGGSWYNDLLITLADAKAKALTDPKVIEILFKWWQGEANAGIPGANPSLDYLNKLGTLMGIVRTNLSPYQVWVEIVRLNTIWCQPGGACDVNGFGIQAAQDLYPGTDVKSFLTNLDSVIPPGSPAGIHYINGQQNTIGDLMTPTNRAIFL